MILFKTVWHRQFYNGSINMVENNLVFENNEKLDNPSDKQNPYGTAFAWRGIKPKY